MKDILGFLFWIGMFIFLPFYVTLTLLVVYELLAWWYAGFCALVFLNKQEAEKQEQQINSLKEEVQKTRQEMENPTSDINLNRMSKKKQAKLLTEELYKIGQKHDSSTIRMTINGVKYYK